MEFYPLIIQEKKQETSDTVSLTFKVPEAQKALFQYRAGQYLTIKLNLDGHELRRAYSMSSAPIDQALTITVKKVAGGRVSTWLNDTAAVGEMIEVAIPDGRFIAKPDGEKKRTWYLFAAGSGITPIISIAKTVLEEEPMSTIYLLYGSRTDADIIFKAELDQMAQRYENQFFVSYVLSKPAKTEGGLFGMFKKTNWSGLKGRIDDDNASAWLEDHLPVSNESDCLYYACGPGNMAEMVEDVLISRGVTAKQIYKELFINAGDAPGEHIGTGGEMEVKVILKGKEHMLRVPADNTILDILVREKIDAPYSCTSGACSTCMAKLKNGKVHMDACYALDDSEVADGYILTCQSHPITAGVVISFDE
jgi:ring-1,2-phenylacetyl-CoA epoxidase subunit PaaE